MKRTKHQPAALAACRFRTGKAWYRFHRPEAYHLIEGYRAQLADRPKAEQHQRLVALHALLVDMQQALALLEQVPTAARTALRTYLAGQPPQTWLPVMQMFAGAWTRPQDSKA